MKKIMVCKILVLLLLYVSLEAEGQTKKYIIVFLNKKSDATEISKEESSKIMEGHMANMGRLAQEGKLLAAGPFEGGGGIFILNTASAEEAGEWISTDPGVQAQRWNIELLPYTPRIGSVCAVKAPYNMVHYTFLRFDAIVSKFNASDYPQILKKHDEFIKKVTSQKNVVTEAIFGDRDGGILIINGDATAEDFAADPAVQEGLVDLQVKKLYIAKGSFCEQ
jgi:uncharacterized protein YciI